MKAIISGCSHSVRAYEAINGDAYFDLFCKETKLEPILVSEKGISNQNILDRVYEILYIEKNVDTILIQFTHLYRMSFWFRTINDYFHFQPSKTENDFQIESWWTEKQLKKKIVDSKDHLYYNFDKNDIVKTFTNFYQYYLVYGFDSEKEKQKIKIQLSFLKEICRQRKIKLISIWFDENELIDDSILNIDDYISLQRWQMDKKLNIGDNQFHLSKHGHQILANAIIAKWKDMY